MENQSWGTPKSRGRGMVKWQPFAAIPEQFIGIREIIKEKTKMPRPVLTQDTKELIENKLLCPLLSEGEILITHYEDGHLLTSYITVTDIDPLSKSVICTDAFYNKITFNFKDIIDVK